MWLNADAAKTEDNTFPGSGTKTPFGMMADFKTAMVDAFSPIRLHGFFIAIENEAKILTKHISNGLSQTQGDIGKAMFSTYQQTLDFGGSMSDAKDYLESYGTELGKIPNIHDDIIVRAVKLSKATGMSTKEVGAFVASLAKMGIGQDVALGKMEKMYLTARKYGVNATMLTKEVLKNISKTSTYGFKDGIDGLTKMVARSQQLGISMDSVMKTAESALDPDKAIEMAASMQMLGGSVGALGDPFHLLYLAQTDIGKLNEEIIDASKNSVKFNEATGEFKLPVSEMYRMREMAKALDLDYQSLADGAVNAAKQTKVLSMITLPSNFNEDDKNLIASLSEIKNGQVMIQIPGQDKMINAQDVNTQAQLDLLRGVADEKGKNSQDAIRDIAKNQLSALDKANISLETIKNSLILAKGAGGIAQYSGMLDDASVVGKKISEQITTSASGFMSDLDDIITKQISDLGDYAGDASKLGVEITMVTQNLKETAYAIAHASTVLLKAEDLLKGLQNTGLTGGGGDVVSQKKDYLDLSLGKKTYSDGFGKMVQLDDADQVLAIPNVDELLNFSHGAYDTLTNLQKTASKVDYGNIMNMLNNKNTPNIPEQVNNVQGGLSGNMSNGTEQINNLQDILSRNIAKMNGIEPLTINQTNTTTQKVEGNVGVDGNVNINVNMPNGLLSNALSGDREFQRSIREEIMNVVNDRLSKAYSRKQGNFKR